MQSPDFTLHFSLPPPPFLLSNPHISARRRSIASSNRCISSTILPRGRKSQPIVSSPSSAQLSSPNAATHFLRLRLLLVLLPDLDDRQPRRQALLQLVRLVRVAQLQRVQEAAAADLELGLCRGGGLLDPRRCRVRVRNWVGREEGRRGRGAHILHPCAAQSRGIA
jgi:hypothetical protein